MCTYITSITYIIHIKKYSDATNIQTVYWQGYDR